MWCDVMSESIMIIPASPMFHVSDRTFTMVSFIETQLARSLDGVLSFFEQESFAFSRMITSSFLCGPPRMTGAELGSRGGKSSSEWKGLKSNPNMPTSSKVLIWCVMMMKWCHTMSYDVLLRVPGPICYVPNIDSFVICALDLQWISGPAATARITSAAMQLRHECNVYRGISLSGCAVLISGDGSMNYVYIYMYII